MGRSLNRACILGNIGKEPEIKSLPSGTAVAEFSVATSHSYKDKNDAWVDTTTWHNCKAFARTAEVIRDYVHAGDKIYIEGRIETRSWPDKDSGKTVYRTEINVQDLTLLGNKGEKSSGTSYKRNDTDPNITDDDIPF